jgi:hypothetical protein
VATQYSLPAGCQPLPDGIDYPLGFFNTFHLIYAFSDSSCSGFILSRCDFLRLLKVYFIRASILGVLSEAGVRFSSSASVDFCSGAVPVEKTDLVGSYYGFTQRR